MNKPASYSHTKTNEKVFQLLKAFGVTGKQVLDVGAGEGYFSKKLGDHLQEAGIQVIHQYLHACDLNPENFLYNEIQCAPANFHEPLPFADQAFDFVVSIEVIEHVENQFHFVQEMHRLLKPGGRAVITTPNVLNINSRFRQLFLGFPQLYNPLPLDSIQPVLTNGHIHPISLYFLAYIFHRCGFRNLEFHIDKRKKSSFLYLPFAYAPIKFYEFLYQKRNARKNLEIHEQNLHILKYMNSIDLLTARTIVVIGEK